MKNAEYWGERFKALEDKQYRRTEGYIKDIECQFKMAKNSIAADIEKWYYRLAENNDISFYEAKKLLSKDELEEFHWTVEEYIKYGKENAINQKWIKQLENASAKVHISRLEAIKMQVQQESEKLYQEYYGGVTDFLGESYADRYYQAAYEIAKGSSVGHNLASIDRNRIEIVLKQPWAQDGKSFSDRIWEDKDKLVNTLHTELSQNIIRGEDPYKAVEMVSKKLQASRNRAATLVYTECAAIASKATKDCFNGLDVEEYKIVATLDSHTSDICQSMDGKKFKTKDYKPGLTAPPFHCNCRSVACPSFDDEFTEGWKRAARGMDGKTCYVPADMKYGEWKEKYVAKQQKETGSDRTAKKGDFLFRSNVPGENITKEKLAVMDVIARLPVKVQDAMNEGTIIDIGKNGSSQYDYGHDILYIAKGGEKEEVIHEIGHMVENKMMDPDKIVQLKRKIIGSVYLEDIIRDTFYNAAGEPVQLFYIRNKNLLSDYQGRIYAYEVLKAFDKDGEFRYDLLWEFISEAFREYIINPDSLKEKNSELFNYMREVVS